MKLQFIVFISVAILIYSLMNFAAYKWLLFMFSPKNFWLISLRIIILSSASFLVIGIMAEHNSLPNVKSVIQPIGYIWLGIIFYLTIFYTLTFYIRLAHKLIFNSTPVVSPNQLSVLGLLILISLASLLTYGAWNASQTHFTKHNLTINVPAANSYDLRIIQLSDIHLNETKSLKSWKSIIDRINRKKPDLILLTGDIFDSSPNLLGEYAQAMTELYSKHGIYAVTGNHEYYINDTRAIKLWESVGVKTLGNRSVTIPGVAHLAGVNDITAIQFHKHDKPILKDILGPVPDNLPVILMNHQPIWLKEAEAAGVDLQLSGHTHGGQIFPFNFLTALAFKFQKGINKIGSMYLIVSTGTSYWGPPLRIGTQNEILDIKIRVQSDKESIPKLAFPESK